MNLIERIDEARARWNVLDHPFYLRWERGDLTREDLAFYAGEYRHAVVALAVAARAVLYAVESAQPDISRTKLTGLIDHYGFTAGSKSTSYFELHSDRDH